MPAQPGHPDVIGVQRDDAHLGVSIVEGKGASMPAWRGRINAEQVQDLVAFVRTLGPGGLDAGAAPASDFARRFRVLRDQWDELDRQAKALAHP